MIVSIEHANGYRVSEWELSKHQYGKVKSFLDRCFDEYQLALDLKEKAKNKPMFHCKQCTFQSPIKRIVNEHKQHWHKDQPTERGKSQ